MLWRRSSGAPWLLAKDTRPSVERRLTPAALAALRHVSTSNNMRISIVSALLWQYRAASAVSRQHQRRINNMHIGIARGTVEFNKLYPPGSTTFFASLTIRPKRGGTNLFFGRNPESVMDPRVPQMTGCRTPAGGCVIWLRVQEI